MSVLSQLKTKSWLPDPGLGNTPGGLGSGESFQPKEKTGFLVILAVVTVVFSITVSAYIVRSGFEDWNPLPNLPLLWFNTGLLALSSIAFQWSKFAADRDQVKVMRVALLIAGVFAWAFLAGQLYAWQQLNEMGYLVTTNPSNAFFYLITGLHGFHLLGGLIAWCKTGLKTAAQGFDLTQVKLNVGLCAVYWHFLLAVWLVFFAMMFS